MLQGVEVHPMEEIKEGIGKAEGLLMLALAGHLPAPWVLSLFGHRARPEETAAILFSSGSEGTPKGIELTHGTDAWVSDLTLRYLPDASHWVQQDEPETVNAMLSAWLRGEPVPEASDAFTRSADAVASRA